MLFRVSKDTIHTTEIPAPTIAYSVVEASNVHDAVKKAFPDFKWIACLYSKYTSIWTLSGSDEFVKAKEV